MVIQSYKKQKRFQRAMDNCILYKINRKLSSFKNLKLKHIIPDWAKYLDIQY